MSVVGHVLSVFDAGRLLPRPPVDDDLLAADSWLVTGGRVRFLDDHGRRFRTACRTAGVDPDETGSFWRAVTAALPREGRWFPRVELSVSGELRLRLRPAPAPGRELTVWPRPGPDPRVHPRTKGPDLPLLAAVRDEARRRGAQEALLTSPTGWSVEGTTSSLLWWEGGTLCVPAGELPVLPGVTTARIQRRAAARGITVAHRLRTVGELAGCEVWLVNALHGIRPVLRWVGSDITAGPARRVATWRAWLEEQWRPLPTAGDDSDGAAAERGAR